MQTYLNILHRKLNSILNEMQYYKTLANCNVEYKNEYKLWLSKLRHPY